MIVLDENVHARTIRAAIGGWYSGAVVSITSLRPGTVIKDDAIPALLLQATQPTFVTINVSDFWRRVDAHPDYCIVLVELMQEEATDVLPVYLRTLFTRKEFSTRASRLGHVIRLTTDAGGCTYYGRDKQIHKIDF